MKSSSPGFESFSSPANGKCFKGTVSRDFWTPVFFIKHISLGLGFIPKNSFDKTSQFPKIFEFQIADDTAESCLRGVIDTAESKLGGVIDTAESMKINFCIWSRAMTQRCHWHRWVKTQRCNWHRGVKAQRCNWHRWVKTQRCHWHRWVSEDTAESI